MASAPVFSKGRDLDLAAAALAPWLAERMGVANVEVSGLSYPRGAGVSNETILFTATSDGGVEHFALRVAPAPDYQLFLDTRFRVQYDLLQTLGPRRAVRVPEALWYEDDRSLLGQPFFVMRQMRGRVPVSMPVYNAEGWLADASPGERRRLWIGAVEQLAAIHQVPVDDVAFLDRPEDGRTGVEQQVTYWTRFVSWALGEHVPDTVRRLLDWVTAHVPTSTRPGLSWGDARIGNIMFSDRFDVLGVMDWEQATLAGPMADLGWWLLFDEVHSVEQGIARLDGLGTRAETIDLWEELTGWPVEDLLWHEIFAGLKAGLLGLRSRQVLNLGSLPASGRGNDLFLSKALRLLETAPGGGR